MKHILLHISSCILRGVLAVIPLLLCFVAILLLHDLIDKQVLKFLAHFFDIRQIPGLGILLLLACLYLIGLIFGNVLGRQILKFIDNVADRIPVIKFIYGVGKQISDTLSVTDPEKQAFKKAVLVNVFNGQGWMLGFVTGTMKDLNGEEMLKVYVPAVPHPLTGLIFIVKQSQVLDCGWTVDEALKIIVSAGIISPAGIRKIT